MPCRLRAFVFTVIIIHCLWSLRSVYFRHEKSFTMHNLHISLHQVVWLMNNKLASKVDGRAPVCIK